MALISAVISEHFSKNRIIISVVAGKYGISKHVRFLMGHPVHSTCTSAEVRLLLMATVAHINLHTFTRWRH